MEVVRVVRDENIAEAVCSHLSTWLAWSSKAPALKGRRLAYCSAVLSKKLFIFEQGPGFSLGLPDYIASLHTGQQPCVLGSYSMQRHFSTLCYSPSR